MGSDIQVSSWTSRSGDDICICGVGARTAVGLSAPASAAAVRASISGLGLHPSFIDQDYAPVSFAADAELTVDMPIPDRMIYMLQSVVEEVKAQVPPLEVDSCWLALPEPRSG